MKNTKKTIKYDTLVVGGGIAGLTATAYLARAGQKVLLIEKNKECGGLVNTFTVDGFSFDAGVRALEDAGIILPMLKDLGIDLQFVKSPVTVGIENDMLNIENIDSLQDYKDLLIKFYPDSKEEIEIIIKNIRNIMKHMDVLYGIENPLFKDLPKDTKFIFKTLLPWFPKFLLTIRKINRMQLPVEEYLENIIQDGSLRDIISQHFFKNTPTFFAMSYFSLYLDYFYPKGGVGKISEAMVSKIIELGGEIKRETKIEKVLADRNTVIDNDGVSYSYDNLIWAANLQTLYQITNVDNLSSEIKTDFQERKKIIMENRGGDSVFSLFVEVDEPLDSFRRITNGHLFYTPSRKGLGKTHREELDKLLNEFDRLKKKDVIKWLNAFIKLNTFEISIPGLKDSSMVPNGKTGVIISFLSEYDLFKKIQEAGWIDEFVSELESKVLDVISDSVFPMLKKKVIKSFSFTPLSIENRVGSSGGGITGWAFREDMPVLNQIHKAGGSVLTPLPSIYKAGQWAYSPAGVPMSILTGKIASDKILK
jgi:phytoene dehydrogenase-like protein